MDFFFFFFFFFFFSKGDRIKIMVLKNPKRVHPNGN